MKKESGCTTEPVAVPKPALPKQEQQEVGLQPYCGTMSRSEASRALLSLSQDALTT